MLQARWQLTKWWQKLMSGYDRVPHVFARESFTHDSILRLNLSHDDAPGIDAG
jgi:hypothetical protein